MTKARRWQEKQGDGRRSKGDLREMQGGQEQKGKELKERAGDDNGTTEWMVE